MEIEFLCTFKERFNKEFSEESLEEFEYPQLLKENGKIYYLVFKSVKIGILKLKQRNWKKFKPAKQNLKEF